MREEKRRRLEGKGWKVGSVKEFLRLPDEEGANVELKLRLAENLRERRRRLRITQMELARALRSRRG